jgi:hypothetical protein
MQTTAVFNPVCALCGKKFENCSFLFKHIAGKHAPISALSSETPLYMVLPSEAAMGNRVVRAFRRLGDNYDNQSCFQMMIWWIDSLNISHATSERATGTCTTG